MRKEHDSLGIQSVPQTAYYGIHTVRARGNFPAVSSVNDRELIKNFLRVKLACARANQKAGRWDDERVPLAIVKACQDLLAHFEEYEDELSHLNIDFSIEFNCYEGFVDIDISTL